MRLLIISDIHLEFGPFLFSTDLPEFDAAVFAGDIHQPVTAAVEWLAQERDTGALKGRPIVYVPGNHEFYNHEMKSELARGQAAADEAGIHMLNRRAVVIGGVRFIGAILWTDYQLLGTPKASMITARDEMNDHRLIRYREDSGHCTRFTPWHAAAEHRKDCDYLREQLERHHNGPTVVVTHHAPHPGSVRPRHQGSSLAPAFASNLSWLIVGTSPELWIHGHDHGSHDYLVGRTRVFANQAGYPRNGVRENQGFRPDRVIEVSAADEAKEAVTDVSRRGRRRSQIPLTEVPVQKPVEISYGEGLGEPLTLEEGQRRLNAYAVAIPLEDWAGAVAEAIELQARIGVERSELDDWQERGAVISIQNGAGKPMFPLAQFVDGRPVGGIAEVTKIVRNPRVAWRWLILPKESIGGTPLDRLKQGSVEEVLQAATRDFA